MNERDLMAVRPRAHFGVHEVLGVTAERGDYLNPIRLGTLEFYTDHGYVNCWDGHEGKGIQSEHGPEEIETFANELLALAKRAREQRCGL